MHKTNFFTLYCNGDITKEDAHNNKYDITVNGLITESVKNNVIHYIASSPADRRISYSGSGFPFHSEKQAFDETPNKGTIILNNNSFQIRLLFPNSYYVELGNKLVPPTLFIRYENTSGIKKLIDIKLGDPIPYRFLVYPAQYTMARNNATFYHAHYNLPVRTQEQILHDSQYPDKNIMSYDFWGLKPAL